MTMMQELNGVKAIWLREFIRFRRHRSRIVTSIVQPLLWLFLFGAGFSAIANVGDGISYQAYLFPGIIGITVLFTSIFFGVSIIWDRQFGFLKEILVAPLSRITIFFGKALGGTTTSMIQGTLILLMGFALDLNLTPMHVIAVLPVMFLLSLTIVSIGLTIGSMMESFEGFNLIMTFLNMPMFFLSGALFPVDDLPAFLKPLSIVNPMTYAVDAFRGIILGMNAADVWYDVGFLFGFCILFLFMGAFVFSRRK